MFPFDQSSLPQLTTRRALIIVDFQHDFLDQDGALPVTEPEGFIDRALQLAASFRASGDVVWVQSRFEEPRPADSDQILATDSLPVLPRTSRGRRSRAALPSLSVDDSDESDVDPEAFLSHLEPVCLKPDSSGAELPAAVKDAVAKADMVLTKTHYSAFQNTPLLRMLRAKMVMEVFICGSLANVGVYATALGAAGHGLSITIVENCCGYRSDSRQIHAVKALLELTGCEIASAAEVLESLAPKKPATASKTSRPSSRRPPPDVAAARDAIRPSMSPDIVQPMTSLRLASDSPAPTGDAQASSKVDEDAGADSVKPVDDGVGKPNTETPKQPAEEPLTTKGEDNRPTPPSQVNPQATRVTGDAESSEAIPATDSPHTSTAESKPTQADAAIPSSAKLPPPSLEKADESDLKVDSTAPEMLQKGLCAGDTDVIEDLLPAALEKGIFYTLKDEIRWQRMSHQGGEVPRLVAVQGEVGEDGSMPVYRHPSDESPPLLPFSPTVLAIKAETEKHLGHPLNHVLIQYYRDGSDYISEHSDKTLDIVRNSYIANISLGAERIMVLRTKRLDKDSSHPASPTPQVAEGTKRQIQRARLPHNSLCRMGLKTNMQWLHSIRQDKRADRDKTSQELAYDGGRISLTFRQIGTFLDRGESIIWGQGATGKTREEAHPVINGQELEAIQMLRAFGTENHASSFDWDLNYGKGFDVLHIRAAPRFFASGDVIVDMRIAIMLAEYGIGYAKGSMAPSPLSKDADVEPKEAGAIATYDDGVLPVKFSDNDSNKTTVQGDVAIMLYIDAVYGQSKANNSGIDRPALAARFTRFQLGMTLLDRWRRLPKQQPSVTNTPPNNEKSKDKKSTVEENQDDTKEREEKKDSSTVAPDPLKPLRRDLTVMESYAAEANGDFLAGPLPSLPDFAVWPVLYAMHQEHGEIVWTGLDNLRKYYDKVKEREGTKKVLGKANTETQKER